MRDENSCDGLPQKVQYVQLWTFSGLDVKKDNAKKTFTIIFFTNIVTLT